MGLQTNGFGEPGHLGAEVRTLGNSFSDFNLQCLRILRCTAKAMANGPGGLRFEAGTRPWLEGLSAAGPALGACSGRQSAVAQLTSTG